MNILNPHSIKGIKQLSRVESDAPDGTPLYDVDEYIKYTVKESQLEGYEFDNVDNVLETNYSLTKDNESILHFDYQQYQPPQTFDDITKDVIENHEKVKDHIIQNILAREQARFQKIEALQDEYIALNNDWEASCQKHLQPLRELKRRTRRGDAIAHVELTDVKNANMSRVKPPLPLPPSVTADSTPGPLETSSEVEASESNTGNEKSNGYVDMHLVDENSMEEMENEKVLSKMLQKLQNINKHDPSVKFERTQANIPNQEITSIDRWICAFDDVNARVIDPLNYYDRTHESEHWTEDQKELFLTAYVDNPKAFNEIALRIPGKTVQDCVLFYYMNKKVNSHFNFYL